MPKSREAASCRFPNYWADCTDAKQTDHLEKHSLMATTSWLIQAKLLRKLKKWCPVMEDAGSGQDFGNELHDSVDWRRDSTN